MYTRTSQNIQELNIWTREKISTLWNLPKHVRLGKKTVESCGSVTFHPKQLKGGVFALPGDASQIQALTCQVCASARTFLRRIFSILYIYQHLFLETPLDRLAFFPFSFPFLNLLRSHFHDCNKSWRRNREVVKYRLEWFEI